MTYYIVLLIAVLALSVLTLSTDVGSGSLLWMVWSLLGSLVYLAAKAHAAKRQAADLHRLRAAYDQLDQQAKLIIRTDLELHTTQEELDRRLASLMSLHQLGRQLQVSLQPEEVFGKLDATIVTNFGFANGLLGRCPAIDRIEWQSLVGVSAATAERVTRHVVESGLLQHTLTNPTPATFRASMPAATAQQQLVELLGVTSVVVAGVLPHSGPAGCLILGRTGSAASTSKADEELVAILANQLAVAIENSALYGSTWTAQQELEHKIQERTRELAQANAELLRLNKSKSDFVSAVSHELRTPLAAIKGYAALLGSGQFGTLATPQQERVAKIERHADLLTQLINNLLDIARIESGRITMARQTIPVDELLATVNEMVHPQLQSKKIRYAIDRDGVTELVGDPQHLQRVFVNLLSNAIKYTPEGGEIRVGLRRDGASIIATVSDTGSGIGPADLPHLFEEFYRANDPLNQQIRGTGLGLALVKRIVEAHHGTISVASQQGRGSTFTISLPATPT